MDKEKLNKIIVGFEFNIGWLVDLTDLLVAIDKVPDLKDKAKPLHMLYLDCIILAKEQGIDLIEELAQYQAGTSDTTQEGG